MRPDRCDVGVVQSYWDDRYSRGRDYWSDETARINAVAELLREAGAQSVLDVGCGVANLCSALRRKGAVGRYLGLDWSMEALRRADPDVHVVQCDASRMPVRLEMFDTVVLTEVVYYLEHPLEWICRLQAWLPPSALMLISAFQPGSGALKRQIDDVTGAIQSLSGFREREFRSSNSRWLSWSGGALSAPGLYSDRLGQPLGNRNEAE
jgi:2-polyprenyl-3-methyl-5-hydroxy-6-metoxy-1,4-benzoquinol methylase